MVKKDLDALKAKAMLALKAPEASVLVDIASSANSPTEAYERAYVKTGDAEKSEACRFLAIIKRDYGKKTFDEFVSPVRSQKPPTLPEHGQEPKESEMTLDTEKHEEVSKEKTQHPIPLQHIDYTAAVNGVSARVHLVQHFTNQLLVPMEAVYIFPMPPEATVISCATLIGDKRIVAELKEREAARKEFEDAISSGHQATLLEQERDNIFTMNVGGIQPGETIQVETDYIQRIPWQGGKGLFSLPLVVGPRFCNAQEVPDASRITPTVLKEGVSYDVDISVSLAPGFRCAVSCPSHPQLVKGRDVKKGDRTEVKAQNLRADRDFKLEYRPKSPVPEVALHCSDFEGENFLLANILPPGTIQNLQTEIFLLLDRSGSMEGAKLAGMKRVAKGILKQLEAQGLDHQVGIIAFSTRTNLLCPLSKINSSMFVAIDGIQDDDMTYLGEALSFTFQQFVDSPRPKVILLITDGEVGSMYYQGSGARVVTVGIGEAVNDAMLKDLARETGGTYEFFLPGADFAEVTSRLASYVSSGPCLRNISIVAAGGEIYGLQDVFPGRPAQIAIRFPKDTKPGSVLVKGIDPNGKELSWQLHYNQAEKCDFAAQIWCREFIRETANAIKQLQASLKYGVLCSQTAFVAVHFRDNPQSHELERVEVPVELPQGWEYGGVFGRGTPKSLGSSRSSSRSLGPRRMGNSSSSGRKGLIGSSSGDDFLSCAFSSDPGDDLSTSGFGPVFGASASDDLDLGGDTTEVSPIPVSSRFTLDADDLVDKLVAVLIAAAAGTDPSEVDKALSELQKELGKILAQLSEEKRAMLYYFALRLFEYGMSLDDRIITILAVKPTDPIALVWYVLASRTTGKNLEAVEPISGCDGENYLKWKLGFGFQPDEEPWSLVP